jgi:hypothetical protein
MKKKITFNTIGYCYKMFTFDIFCFSYTPGKKIKNQCRNNFFRQPWVLNHQQWEARCNLRMGTEICCRKIKAASVSIDSFSFKSRKTAAASSEILLFKTRSVFLHYAFVKHLRIQIFLSHTVNNYSGLDLLHLCRHALHKECF